MYIVTERDWDALREERETERARDRQRRLAEMIEVAENDGDYELAARRARAFAEHQDEYGILI